MMKFIPRWALVLALISGCGGSDGNSVISDPISGSGGSSSTGSGGSSSTGSTVSGEGNYLNVDAFPFNQITSGGVPMDGIPALTDPTFVTAESADAGYLLDGDLVMGVVVGGEVKAYPHNIGWWHEIVNDVVGQQPVVASLCPLTGTGLVFDGAGDGARITTGVSGLLFSNNLIMYDRRDNETLYPQMIFKAIQGPRKNEELQLLPVVETTWGYWKKLYPNTKVVSGQTGVYGLGSYRDYPYGAYRSPGAPPLFPTTPSLNSNPTAQAYSPKNMTLGIRIGRDPKAYPFPAMGEEAVINDELGRIGIVVVFYKREQLAIPYRRDIVHNDNALKLTFDKVSSTSSVYPFMMKDKETGSTWNLLGEAIDGELKGTQLLHLPAHNAFWFAWATFWQKTAIYTPG